MAQTEIKPSGESRREREERERDEARAALELKRIALETGIMKCGGWLTAANAIQTTPESLKRLVRNGTAGDVSAITARLSSARGRGLLS